MLGKIRTYFWTVRYLKPGQIFWRIGKRMGMKCALKGAAPSRAVIPGRFCAFPELDYDPEFLSRFCVDELMRDRVTFLYDAEDFDWEGNWHVANRSHLWNFNLHYFEFIHPLTKRYLETGDRQFLDKTLQMIRGWIHQNPQKNGGNGWFSYTISLRLTNWMAYLAAVGPHLTDADREELEDSMFQQYVYLSTHLEKENLGNHYFENLKTLVLCALFFGDEKALPIYIHTFTRECRAEILPDGMHFELSPMYHKIVFEGLLRVAASLRRAQRPDAELEQWAQDMLDAAYTMEHGLNRIPLFNDCGDNVAKSLDGLLAAAKNHLGLMPSQKEALPDSGYYFFENGPWKLIVDAGAVGPDYMPGHSHCDAMSFELFRRGEPVLVNCGTYAYQCKERPYFRSTGAHNTVQAAATEQSEAWGVFRMARRSKTQVLEVMRDGIRMEMTDCKGNRIQREILLKKDAMYIHDQADALPLQSHLHSISEIEIISAADITRSNAMYAPEYGRLQTIQHITAAGNGNVELTVPLT